MGVAIQGGLTSDEVSAVMYAFDYCQESLHESVNRYLERDPVHTAVRPALAEYPPDELASLDAFVASVESA